MAKLVWSVLCQQALIDRQTNNLSLINTIDEVHPARPQQEIPKVLNGKKVLPIIPMTCSLVTLWERDRLTISESASVRASLVGPDGKTLLKIEAVIDLRKSIRARVLANLPGLPVAGNGTYKFVLRLRSGVTWRRVGQLSYEFSYAFPRKLN
jgi:hypothetical protein